MKSLIKILIVVGLVGLTAGNVEGQIKLNLKNKIENKVNQKVNQEADQAIDKGVDKVEGDIKGDAKTTDQANEDQKAQDNTQAGANNADQGDKTAGQEQTQLQAYSKYDFVPGEKVIFYEDFSQDAVGDFPALWNTNGSAEVVTTIYFPVNG